MLALYKRHSAAGAEARRNEETGKTLAQLRIADIAVAPA
jgi:hypothetical protein